MFKKFFMAGDSFFEAGSGNWGRYKYIHIHDLQQQPGCHQVGDAYTDDIPAFEFFKKAHLASSPFQ